MTINFAVVWLIGLLLWVAVGLPTWPSDGIRMLVFGTTIWALFYSWLWICTRFPLVGVFLSAFIFGLFGGRRRW
jgi:hypothetical protein